MKVLKFILNRLTPGGWANLIPPQEDIDAHIKSVAGSE